MARRFPLIKLASYYLGPSDRPQHSWTALWFVKAIKGDEVKSTCHVPVCGRWEMLSSETAGKAFDWFGEMAGHRLHEELELDGESAIIPLPPSKLVRGAAFEGAPRQLSHALDEWIGGGVFDCLRWKSPQQSARSGGPRAAEVLYQNLAAVRPRDRKTCILVDDVSTTGGHISAAARAMRDAGCPVVGAIVAGQTMRDDFGDTMPDNSFRLPTEQRAEYDPNNLFWGV